MYRTKIQFVMEIVRSDNCEMADGSGHHEKVPGTQVGIDTTCSDKHQSPGLLPPHPSIFFMEMDFCGNTEESIMKHHPRSEGGGN